MPPVACCAEDRLRLVLVQDVEETACLHCRRQSMSPGGGAGGAGSREDRRGDEVLDERL